MRCRLLVGNQLGSHSRRKPGSTHRRPRASRNGSRLSPGMRCFGLQAAAFMFGLLASAGPAGAETAPLRLMRPLDLVALPLLVMEHEHLIERTAEAMGLGIVTVTWSTPGKTNAIEALAAGDSDLVAADLAPFLVAADATAGTPTEVRGLG